mmetsp:Transcript_46406/g.118477  ORF Transcript_46406/g.118477 Transcript_46406/m.118477 type:complete len:287 (+) Transcript_46406:128-988(+)
MFLSICISSAPGNVDRRRALRTSWLGYLTSADSILPPDLRSCVEYYFVLGKESEPELRDEAKTSGDLLFIDAPEGYGNLWRKTLEFLRWADQRAEATRAPGERFFMHADDDSFVRLDKLLPLMQTWPCSRWYWGYIWDPASTRNTAPIRNQANKSFMPEEQYPFDFYPPFASGCGFVLSWDLVQALLAQPLPDYRLLDPPFGIHLTGKERCCMPEPVTPVHDPLVRPYRPWPIYRDDTIIQHYLQPAEMRPFYLQATGQVDASDSEADARISALYSTFVDMGLLRQ